MNKNLTKVYVPSIYDIVNPKDSLIYVDVKGNHYSYNKNIGDFMLLSTEFYKGDYYDKEEVENRLKSLSQSPDRVFATANISGKYKITLPIAGQGVTKPIIINEFISSNEELLVLSGDSKSILNKKTDDNNNKILVTYDISLKPIMQEKIGSEIVCSLGIDNFTRKGISVNNHLCNLHLDDPIKPITKIIMQEILDGNTSSIGGDITFIIFKNDVGKDIECECSIIITVEKLYQKYKPHIEVKEYE